MQRCSFYGYRKRESAHLRLSPDKELLFENPGKEPVEVSLHLHNPLDEPVHFKIKVTAPKRYCVRPNQGCIDPQSEKDISIVLTNLKPEELGGVCKDKFLVQTIVASKDVASEDLFKTKNEATGEVRLNCKFVSDREEASLEATVPNSDSISSRGPNSEPMKQENDPELEKCKKINMQLTKRVMELTQDLDSYKKQINQNLPRTKSSAQSTAVTDASGFPEIYQLLLALLLGWLVGHFVL